MYKRYETKNAIGVYVLNNFGGLEILDLEYDYAIACFNFGDGRKCIRRHKIQTSSSGRSYIRKYNIRYYFDTIVRL